VTGADTRESALEQLATRRFDLLVVGAGIVGAGVAAEAARAGLAVALVDRGDFGGETTSASSKLIHGGLRYLRLGDVGLVREAHQERRLLMRTTAPHLVRRLPFLLPLYRDGPYGPVLVQAGLALYSALARARLSRLLSPESARMRVPALRLDGLRSCGLYADAVTHDGRLALESVRAAADAGATVVNYAEVRAFRIARGRIAGAEIDVEGGVVSVSARAVVNATGPWVDQVRLLEDPAARPSIRLSKGVHVLVALDRPWTAALTLPQDDVRVSFAVPWQGMLLLGTTDTLHDGAPGTPAVTADDIDQVLAEAAVGIEPDLLRREAIRSTFAGLRVLPLGRGGTTSARRETVVSRGPAGMTSVAGGKLTTFRRIAVGVLAGLGPELGLQRIDPRPWPLPGAVDPSLQEARLARIAPALEPSARAHLTHLYGSRTEDVLSLAADDPHLLQPLHPDGPDLAVQVLYAVRREWARTPDDVLRRRTTVAVRGLATTEVVARVSDLISRPAPAGAGRGGR
jgi:glycerol-3-phosphate dehydrogenase